MAKTKDVVLVELKTKNRKTIKLTPKQITGGDGMIVNKSSVIREILLQAGLDLGDGQVIDLLRQMGLTATSSLIRKQRDKLKEKA